ncbi:type II toxin-antitoxin system VapC family toxin [Rhodocaloribacter litoris]|uniref:type II toxin-antitoxin system VapC family toxin n=1 Tax=Rhodocaloribacter litoris TaxID=2558931 RepID=UPI00141E7541|nr:type II toxin-antitoxin system VapC family toxin [Rhodocaloribacter litoris]QXD14493.1 type II toxin-antitoxin system VapC family toxin [Rhodocaloribacter litoris]
MRLLLDTHSFLWFIGGDERLSARAREVIADIENEAYLSVASLWEMAIKINLGKLRLPRPFGVFVPEQIMLNEIKILHVELPHISRYIELPLYHRDPFDRLLAAQAYVEGMTVVSKDEVFARYEVDLLW